MQAQMTAQPERPLDEGGVRMPKLAAGLRVVDADSHMTERCDLFTARAPKGFEDKVPHVEQVTSNTSLMPWAKAT
jgi:hypothetical protein